MDTNSLTINERAAYIETLRKNIDDALANVESLKFDLQEVLVLQKRRIAEHSRNNPSEKPAPRLGRPPGTGKNQMSPKSNEPKRPVGRPRLDGSPIRSRAYRNPSKCDAYIAHFAAQDPNDEKAAQYVVSYLEGHSKSEAYEYFRHDLQLRHLNQRQMWVNMQLRDDLNEPHDAEELQKWKDLRVYLTACVAYFNSLLSVGGEQVVELIL